MDKAVFGIKFRSWKYWTNRMVFRSRKIIKTAGNMSSRRHRYSDTHLKNLQSPLINELNCLFEFHNKISVPTCRSAQKLSWLATVTYKTVLRGKAEANHFPRLFCWKMEPSTKKWTFCRRIVLRKTLITSTWRSEKIWYSKKLS